MSELQTNPESQSNGVLRVIPHYDQLDNIVGTLLAAREANEFPYDLDGARLPQDERHMPETLPRGGAEHANFLWASCYWMRGGIKSSTAFRNLSTLYVSHPELFYPDEAKDIDEETIATALSEHQLQFSLSTIKGSWKENARRMSQLYGGDPRHLFTGLDSYNELLTRVKNDKKGGGFVGFQEKMVSMIAYYLMEADLVPYFDFPLPVDFHVLRVSAATEIITFENVPEDGNIYSPQTLSTLREIYHDYSVRHGVSQIDVCNAVWSLSAAICGIQPGNQMSAVSGRARGTVLKQRTVDFSNPKDARSYAKSCLNCPVEHACIQNFPSKVYYVLGKMIGSERQRPGATDPDALFSLNALSRRKT